MVVDEPECARMQQDGSERLVRTDELRRADGELVVHYAPEPVWYSMSTGERVVLGWLADEKASRWQVGGRRSHPLDQRPVQGSGVYMVKPRTHDESERAPTEHLVLQRHPKGQPDVPDKVRVYERNPNPNPSH